MIARLLIVVLGWRLVSSLSVERRRSTLIPWIQKGSSSSDESPSIGWALEIRDQKAKTLKVTIGWGDQDVDSDGVVNVELPYAVNEDSLASTLWPAGIAAAILCRSPAVVDYMREKSVLELGSGLGLLGLTAADVAANCLVTDNDEEVVKILQDVIAKKSLSNVQAQYLEWRDEHDVSDKVDAVIASDVAYYYFLLRPLMDTTRAYMKENALFLCVGQANRASYWDLYDNLALGCYNQLTDEREPPWLGTTQMLLYHLKMEDWIETKAEGEQEEEATMDGVVPIALMLHQNEGCNLPALTEYDYMATDEDREEMSITF
jgi:predicted nicotinamide N-methyase